MRSSLLALALAAACGGSNSGSTGDANPGGDGNGNGDSLGGNPTAVTVTLTNQPTAPATFSFLAAYQDGAGAWQLAPAPSGDTYTFTINAPVWGFAWTCIVPGSNPVIARVELAYFTVTEKTSLTESVPLGCTDRLMVVGSNGTVSNMSNGGAGFTVAYATRTNQVNRNTGQFGIESAAGPHDLFIAHGALTGNSLADDAVVRTTATAPQAGIAIDWNTNMSLQTAAATAPAMAAVTSTLYSAGNTQITFGVTGGNTPSVIGLPDALAMSGDLYQFSSTTRAQGASEVAETWTNTFAAQTFTAPSPLGGATSSVPSTAPYPIVRTTWNAYASTVGYTWDAREGASGTTGGAAPTEWTAIIGPGYVGATPAFQMPDLSPLTGWAAAFQLVAGTPVIGTVVATTSSAGATDFPTVNPPANGTTRTVVTSGWTVTP